MILPQAFAISMPAIGANCLFLMKETSVISAVAVAELMFIAKEIIGMDYKTNESLFFIGYILSNYFITYVNFDSLFRKTYSESKIWGLNYYSKVTN